MGSYLHYILGQLFNLRLYLEQEKVKSLASYDIIKIKLDLFNSEFGNKLVSDIKPVDLENYQAKRTKEGRAPATVDQEIKKAKTMVLKAFDNDLVGGDAVKAFNRTDYLLKRGADVRTRVLSPAEFQALVNHSRGHTRAVIMTGYYTGMRKGEILNLTWDKVDLRNRMIRLEASDTKDSEKRDVPICDELYKMLVSMPNRIQRTGQDNHVFQYKGKPVKDVRSGLKRACKNAGITYGRFAKRGFIFHDLRHTFNTYMRKAGVQESVIMDITGHSTRDMFDRYNTVDEDDTRKAVDQMSAFLNSVDHPVDQVGVSEQKKINDSL